MNFHKYVLYCLVIVIAAFLLSGCQAGNREASCSTDWFHEAKWGIMACYLADPLAASGGGKGKDFVLDSESWNKQVDSFDVKGLADQLQEIGVKYYLITLGQNSGHYCSPNATYDKIVGIATSKCSRRDLIADLYKELEPRDIKLILYLPCQVPNRDVLAQKAFNLTQGSKDQPIGIEFAGKWAEVIHDWSSRYGNKVAGWWFDGAYEWVGFNDEIAEIYTEAVKRGNPNAIIAFNPGVKNPIAAVTEHEDYTAGEIAKEMPICSERFVIYKGKEIQYHIMSYLGKGWGVGDRPRYSTNKLIEYTRCTTDGGGVVTWDVPFEKNGLIPSEFIEPLKKLSSTLKASNNKDTESN